MLTGRRIRNKLDNACFAEQVSSALLATLKLQAESAILSYMALKIEYSTGILGRATQHKHLEWRYVMKKLRRLRKGLAILLSIAMVLGLMPGVGIQKVSAEEEGSANVISLPPSPAQASPPTQDCGGKPLVTGLSWSMMISPCYGLRKRM